MNTLNRRSTDSFYVKPQVNERPLRRATDSFVNGVVTKNGYSVNRPIVSDSLSKTIPIRKETLPSRPHNGLEQIDSVPHHQGLVRRPDILHIQAIGPAIMTPLARLFGLNVVVTHHGPDYDRQKWGFFAKLVLRIGEYFGMRCANERIAISKESLIK